MEMIGKVNNIPRENDIEWTIPDFCSLSVEDGGFFYSPQFSFADAFWCLFIYPNGDSAKDSVGYIDLCLGRQSPGSPISMEFSLGLKTLDGKKDDYTHILAETEKGYGAVCYILRSELLKRKSELMPADVLTVICSLRLSRSTKDSSDVPRAVCSYCEKSFDAENISSHQKKCLDKPIKCPECSEVVLLQSWYDHRCHTSAVEGKNWTPGSQKTYSENKLLQDIKELFLKEKYCDVVINVKEQEFPAHKIILTARSSVFESIFKDDIVKKEADVLIIEDCDPLIFLNFLYFLYCGNIQTTSIQNMHSLLVMANKYKVQDLKTICVDFLKKNLTVDNFCSNTILALQHSEEELVKFVKDFFMTNLEKIVATVNWQSFIAANPTLHKELLGKTLLSENNLNV